MNGQLEGRTAVIYGAGGALGGAMARTFAREGARLFLAGRTLARLEAVARDVRAAGGAVELAAVDVLDERAVDAHADAVARKAGTIDVAVTAVSFMHVQGRPFAELSLEDFFHPIAAFTRANFVTAHAVARHMMKAGRGVILTLSTAGRRMAIPGLMGYGVTCAAVEHFSRLLAAELGPSGVRVACLRPHGIPEARAKGSYTRELFRPWAERAGTSVDGWLEAGAQGTLLRRLPTLYEVAETAVFLVSDRAGAITGSVANLTCGAVDD
jgi:NAD(P)-dependent dehydrogenase (short-subunit alcohol dehydrogenase family)